MKRHRLSIVMIVSFLLGGVLAINVVCAAVWNIDVRVELGRITLNWFSGNNRTTGWVGSSKSVRWSWGFSHVYYLHEKTPPGIGEDYRVHLDSEELQFDVLGVRYYKDTSSYPAYYLSTPAFVLPWPFLLVGLWSVIKIRWGSHLAGIPAFPPVMKKR